MAFAAVSRDKKLCSRFFVQEKSYDSKYEPKYTFTDKNSPSLKFYERNKQTCIVAKDIHDHQHWIALQRTTPISKLR